jgi:hypothetical protein
LKKTFEDGRFKEEGYVYDPYLQTMWVTIWIQRIQEVKTIAGAKTITGSNNFLISKSNVS